MTSIGTIISNIRHELSKLEKVAKEQELEERIKRILKDGPSGYFVDTGKIAFLLNESFTPVFKTLLIMELKGSVVRPEVDRWMIAPKRKKPDDETPSTQSHK